MPMAQSMHWYFDAKQLS